ncbi:MAG: Hsp20 family protein, partial [Actinobacteria bacterium]|nr:Hsp20 family protein [Actinomycetota bacterium]
MGDRERARLRVRPSWYSAEQDLHRSARRHTHSLRERELSSERSRGGFYRFERRYGSFSRAVGVPQGVDEESVKADCRDGVLEIRIAKPAVKKPRRIQIGGGRRAGRPRDNRRQRRLVV